MPFKIRCRSPSVLISRFCCLDVIDIVTCKPILFISQKQVREMWKRLENFYTKHANDRAAVETIIEGTYDKYKVDSNEMDVKIPDLLLRECESEIHRVSYILHAQLLSQQDQSWDVWYYIFIYRILTVPCWQLFSRCYNTHITHAMIQMLQTLINIE